MSLRLRALFIVLLFIGLCLFCWSCGTTNKVKTSTHTKTDSTSSIKKDTAATTTKDSTHVIKDNTVTTKVTDGEFTKTTVIEFDTSGVIGIPTKADTFFTTSGDHSITDYFPLRPIKKITIRETGKQSIKEQTNTAKIDSTKTNSTTSIQAHTEQDTHVTTEITTKNKEVHRTSFGWLWLLILIPIGYVAYKKWLQPYWATSKYDKTKDI